MEGQPGNDAKEQIEESFVLISIVLKIQVRGARKEANQQRPLTIEEFMLKNSGRMKQEQKKKKKLKNECKRYVKGKKKQ